LNALCDVALEGKLVADQGKAQIDAVSCDIKAQWPKDGEKTIVRPGGTVTLRAAAHGGKAPGGVDVAKLVAAVQGAQLALTELATDRATDPELVVALLAISRRLKVPHKPSRKTSAALVIKAVG